MTVATVTHNHNVKSQLAKLLAMEDITVQHRSDIKTAMFDVQNRILYLPVWRQMSNDLYDLLVVHEVGHALDTPSDGWVEEIKSIANRVTGSVSKRALGAVKGFLNVIEDCRIDKRQKRRYPGSRRNYIAGYKELMENNFFGTQNRDVNSMIFIDRINIHFKAGVSAGVKFSAEEMKFVKRIEDAETWSEVIQLTEEIFKFCKDEKEQPRGDDGEEDSDDFNESEWDEWDETEGDGANGDGEDEDSDSDEEENQSGKSKSKKETSEESDEEDGDGDDADGEEDSDEESEGKAKGKSKESDDSDDGEDSEDDGDETDDGETGEGKSSDGASKGATPEKSDAEEGRHDDLPVSETEKHWEEKSQDLVASSDIEYVYVNVPTPVLSSIVSDYKEVLQDMKANFSHTGPDWYSALSSSMVKWKTAENSTISFLVKEFETRKAADTYSKIQIAKTGVINTNKLHSYKYNEDIFRRNTVVPAGKNHGFVMIVDWSGSMHGMINHTLKQLFTLVMFCKRVQIPFEVYTFRDLTTNEAGYNVGFGHRPHNHNSDHQKYWTFKNNSMVFEDFKLRHILSSRMNAAEMNAMMTYLFNARDLHYANDPMGGTPLNAALAMAPEIVSNFQKRTKVQIVNTIVLTDGQSAACSEVHGRLNRNYSQKKAVNFVLEDEVLKKHYDLGKVPGYGNIGGVETSKVTSILLNRLKERTGCNLVGFYLTTSSFANEFRSFFGYGTDDNFEKEMKKSWTENGFMPVKSVGYDKYFILSDDAVKVKKVVLDIKENMTRKTMTKEFMKFSSVKKVNRVLLRQFIEEIAS